MTWTTGQWPMDDFLTDAQVERMGIREKLALIREQFRPMKTRAWRRDIPARIHVRAQIRGRLERSRLKSDVSG